MHRLSSVKIGQTKVALGQKPLVAMTAYDYTTAKLIDSLVDIVLVGDSLGMVIQGNADTLSVTVEDMIYHSKCVAKGLENAHLVVDMPFMSYQPSIEIALKNAGRMLAEGKGQSVKIEGGVGMAATVARLVEVGIPVMGHVGLTPQSVNAFGGYKVQGKTESQRNSILEDALAIEDAGAYAIVLEGIPAELAKVITERLKIPTIGIGAGVHCDGQILVLQDVLGLNIDFLPKFVKKYAELATQIPAAIGAYATEVRERRFPTDEHSFHVNT